MAQEVTLDEMFGTPQVTGQLKPGNIDLQKRPVVKRPSGAVATVKSFSIGTPDGEVLLPSVSDDGRMLSEAEAIALYKKTKKHLGIFSTPEAATEYAKKLHEDQDLRYGDGRSETTISLEDMGLPSAPVEADKGFFARQWDNLKLMNEEGKKEFLESPVKSAYGVYWGAAKSLASGIVGLGETAAKGYAGLTSMIAGGGFDKGSESVDKWLEADREASKGLLYINLAPDSQLEEGFNKLLGIIPEGITAAGDTVYEKTGSALAGSGSQTLLTLLTLKPSAATKPFQAFKKVSKGERVTAGAKAAGEKVSSAIDELSVTDPKAVEALKEHVKGADPELGELLDKALKEAKGKNPVDVGVEVAKQPEPAKPTGPDYRLEEVEGKLHIVKSDGKWKSQPISDRNAAKLKLEQLNELAEKNSELKVKAEGLKKSTEGISKSVEQGMKVLSELPIAPEVKMTSVERRSALRLSNEAYAEQLRKEGGKLTEEGKRALERLSKATDNVVDITTKLEEKEFKAMSSQLREVGIKSSFESVETLAKDYEAVKNKVPKDERDSVSERRINEAVEELKALKPEDKVKIEEKLAVLKYELETGVKSMNFNLERINKPGYDKARDSVWRSGKDEAVKAENQVQQSFKVLQENALEPPGMELVKGKLTEYYEQLIRTVNPEALGREAQVAASTLAKHIAIEMQKNSTLVHRATERQRFWDRRLSTVADFLKKFEKGQKFSDPVLQQVAEAYRAWNERIFKQDQALGIKYEPKDNYLFHVFEDSAKVSEFFRKHYGNKWNNPGFMKDRQFELYDQAVKAGFKPKFKNPEDIMLARQHASDVAQMQVEALREMKNQGIAILVEGDNRPQNWSAKEWRAPNGERYWVHDSADAVLHNAFNTQSLWAMKGIGGDIFRGAMFLKNTTVPIALALSLFHPLHVATIANATGMVRASKGLLSGTVTPARFVKEMIEAGVYKDLLGETGGQLGTIFGMEPKGGYRLLKAYQGKLKDTQITSGDRQALTAMAEGGFIPEMSSQFKTTAITSFREAIARRSASALWHAPFAAISALQRPMFEIWIPSLKIASYLKDVKTALETNPKLVQDTTARQLAFRKLAKSVDNRYGEMAYKTLFWNRWIKDLAVANTLSLGWQMGFIREYGGGGMDLARLPRTKGSFVEKVSKGDLDRPLFVTYYTAQALAYGGLLTWALSGEEPQSLEDYVYPRTGETMPNGRPERVNTMFYPREFASIYHHVEKEGLVGGLGHLASSKASGVVGLTSEWARGVNDFGEEIRDPDAPAYKQLQQTLAATLEELQPISIQAIRESTSENKVRSVVLNVSGFSPAPKYVTETKTEGLITGTFRKYFTQTQTPFEKAQFSDDRRKLRKAFEAGDSDTYSTVLEKMQEKFELTGMEVRRLERSLAKGEDPLVAMFGRLTWRQQKKILDQMTEEEREVYLPASNKEHLRYSYEPPEER